MHKIQAAATTSRFLEGLDHPISQAEPLTAARKAQPGPTIRDALERLPERDYEDADEVTGALDAAS